MYKSVRLYVWMFCLCISGALCADVQQMRCAIEQNDMEQVEKLLAAGTNVNACVDERQFSLLHVAAYSSSTDMVALLLDKGANINACTTEHVTPLMSAASKNNEKNVRLFIARGARLGIRNSEGLNAFHVAIQYHSNNLVPIFMDARFQFDYEAFAWAVKYNNVPMLEYGISHGMPVNEYPGSPIPLLHLAIYGNSVEAMQFLYEHGARLDDLCAYPLPDPRGCKGQAYMNAFMIAVLCNNVQALDYLAKKGASAGDSYAHVEASEKVSINPVGIAVYQSAYEALEWLWAHGYTCSEVNKEKDTLLHLAVRINNPQMAEYLLNKGFVVNQENGAGQTPLHYACRAGNYDTCSVLIAYGADINKRDHTGESPLIYAVRENHTEIAELLLACGETAIEWHVKAAYEYAKSNRNIRLCKHLAYHEEHAYEDLSTCPFCKPK